MIKPYLAIAFMFISVPALADAKVCSGDGADQQVLEFLPTEIGNDQFTVSQNGKKTHWSFISSAGSGIRGRVYKNEAGKMAATIEADIEMDSNVEPPKTQHVLIFQDRAFWPCK